MSEAFNSKKIHSMMLKTADIIGTFKAKERGNRTNALFLLMSFGVEIIPVQTQKWQLLVPNEEYADLMKLVDGVNEKLKDTQ